MPHDFWSRLYAETSYGKGMYNKYPDMALVLMWKAPICDVYNVSRRRPEIFYAHRVPIKSHTFLWEAVFVSILRCKCKTPPFRSRLPSISS